MCILRFLENWKRAAWFVTFNERERDIWVSKIAADLPKDTRVIDVGAGSGKYRNMFGHCKYTSQDFGKARGSAGSSFQYGKIDIVSDLTNIPVADNSFEVILCTEVLEHVSEPIKAIEEFSRILKHKGRLFISAPLGSGLHMTPHHYYGGFTPSFYKKFLRENKFKKIEIKPNGGLLKHFLQESNRVGIEILKKKKYNNSFISRFFAQQILRKIIPIILYPLDKDIFVENFTVGYFVEAIKM